MLITSAAINALEVPKKNAVKINMIIMIDAPAAKMDNA